MPRNGPGPSLNTRSTPSACCTAPSAARAAARPLRQPAPSGAHVMSLVRFVFFILVRPTRWIAPPTRIRRTLRIMDYMIATGLAAEFDVRATRRSSRSEPALGTLPERGLAAGKRSVLPVTGVAAVGQAPSNSQPIRSGRPPCAGTSTGLAVDNATVRLARSHVHTGFTERLRGPALTQTRAGPSRRCGVLRGTLPQRVPVNLFLFNHLQRRACWRCPSERRSHETLAHR